MRFIIIPGIDGSDAEHWQSLWEADWGTQATRIAPASWSEPSWEDWQQAISSAVAQSVTATSTSAEAERPVLVAHSLGCLAAAAWLQTHPGVAVAFLAAVPDPAGPLFPATADGFGVAAGPLGSPAVVVASSDDPYASSTLSRRVAEQWGATWLEAGALGTSAQPAPWGCGPRAESCWRTSSTERALRHQPPPDGPLRTDSFGDGVRAPRRTTGALCAAPTEQGPVDGPPRLRQGQPAGGGHRRP